MADAGLETIIYIIVFFLWMLANVFSRSKRNQKRRGGAPLPRPGETSAEAEIREFLEQLSGKPAEEMEEPVEAPPPPPVRVIKARPRPRHTGNLPDIVPLRRIEVPAIPEETVDMESIARQMRDAAPSMASSMSTSLVSHGNLFKSAGAVLPSLRFAMGSSRPAPANPVIRRDELHDPHKLRNLVAAKVILGPPRAWSPVEPGN